MQGIVVFLVAAVAMTAVTRLTYPADERLDQEPVIFFEQVGTLLSLGLLSLLLFWGHGWLQLLLLVPAFLAAHVAIKRVSDEWRRRLRLLGRIKPPGNLLSVPNRRVLVRLEFRRFSDGGSYAIAKVLREGELYAAFERPFQESFLVADGERFSFTGYFKGSWAGDIGHCEVVNRAGTPLRSSRPNELQVRSAA